MFRKVARLIICLILLIGLCGCQIIPGDEPKVEEQYEIFLLAKKSGYIGTYEEWLESIKGETGRGILLIEKTSTNGLIDTYTITFTDESKTIFTVTNGKDGIQGIQGEKGEDGHTPVISIQNGNWYIDGVDTGYKASVTNNDLYINANSYGINPGLVDANILNDIFKNEEIKNKYLIFPDGEYIFSNTINLESNWRIEGSSNTIFKLDESSSDSILMKLYEVDNVRISNIKFEGYNTSKPNVEGNKIGIVIEKCRSINLTDLDIYGFSKYGIYSKTMSSYGDSSDGAFYKQLQIDNCRFYFNYYGTYFDYRCEYTQTSNCVFGENYIGSLNAGGNNIYTGCMWNSNTIGFYLENNGSNPAHGGCNGCTFNHNSSHAIYIENCINGWVFNGCQIFYGKIELLNSKGVIFDSNILGSCYLYSTFEDNENVNLISDTYFLTDIDKILKNNDGSTKIINSIPEYIKKEKVTLKYNDGSEDQIIEVVNGEKITEPDIPTKEGFEFIGWYIDSNFETLYDFNTIVSEDLTLFAKWEVLKDTNADLNWDCIIDTGINNSYLSLSTNAYSGASTHILDKNIKINYLDFVINKANKDTIITGLNLWVVNNDNGQVTEQLIINEDYQVIYSDALSSYVVRLELNIKFDYPSFFVVQSTRTSDGVGIAYYKNTENNTGYLRGDRPLIIGETLESNSNIIPVYRIYNNELLNVSINFIGDSITYGVGTETTYWKYLQENKKIGSINAYGISGSCISSTSDYGSNNSPLVNRYINLPYADVFVIFMGTNDYGHETPIGTIADNTDISFYGALNIIVSGLQNKYKSSKIVFITPLKRYGFGTSKILNQQFTYDTIPNGQGATLNDYREAIINICNKYSLSYIDLYNESPFNPENEAEKNMYMPDGLHPNELGHEIIFELIINHLYSLEIEKSDSDTIQMQYGNKFASGFNDRSRASSTKNIYLEEGTIIKLLNSYELQWAIGETVDEYSNTKISGYYPESQWSSIDTYVVTKSGYYGFTFKYITNQQFNFEENPETDDLMVYISINKNC